MIEREARPAAARERRDALRQLGPACVGEEVVAEQSERQPRVRLERVGEALARAFLETSPRHDTECDRHDQHQADQSGGEAQADAGHDVVSVREAVTDAAHRLDLVARGAELLAQSLQVGVDGALGDRDVGAPDLVEQALSREHAPRT